MNASPPLYFEGTKSLSTESSLGLIMECILTDTKTKVKSEKFWIDFVVCPQESKPYSVSYSLIGKDKGCIVASKELIEITTASDEDDCDFKCYSNPFCYIFSFNINNNDCFIYKTCIIDEGSIWVGSNKYISSLKNEPYCTSNCAATISGGTW